jgi:hypothetical protein
VEQKVGVRRSVTALLNCPHKDKRGIDLICDSKIVLGGTAALHTSGVGGGLFFRCLPPVFDCRTTDDAATINK